MSYLNKKEIIKQYSNYLIYDGDCPFCSKFVELMDLKRAMPLLKLHNARLDNQLVMSLYNIGYDLNTGMVLVYQDKIFYEDECVHKLSQIIEKSIFFNKIIYLCFSNILLARILYPILRAGRYLWLYIKKIPPIR